MSSSPRLRRALWSAASLSGCLATYVGYRIYREGSFDIYNVGAARFGRAAVTVRMKMNLRFWHLFI